MTFDDFLDDQLCQAEKKGRYLTLAQLSAASLGQHPRSAEPRFVDARRQIETVLARGARRVGDSKRATFRLAAARESFRSFHGTTPEKDGPKELPEKVLLWLFRSGFDDRAPGAAGTLGFALEVCRRFRIDLREVVTVETEGTSFWIGESVPGAEPPEALFGREEELGRHLSQLAVAVEQRRHYLIEGHRGVGKSVFVRTLVHRAWTQWQVAGGSRSRLRFRLFDKTDFLGSQDDNRQVLHEIHRYLESEPLVVPIFDGLEVLLSPNQDMADDFLGLFGGSLEAGGRTFVLVCRAEIVRSSGLYRYPLIGQQMLPALAPDATRRIVEGQLQRFAAAREPVLGFPNGVASVAEAIVEAARGRYPNRFLPEVALHLAIGTLEKSRARLASEQGAEPEVDLDDLWQHISEELSLTPELLGRDPSAFYRSVRQQLKEDVIGQDHAVDLICQVLEMLAGRLQREPRGRFLFVGPPGVGKTYLARSLARRLGYGDEAFFVFNMSEYSTEMARTRFLGSDPGYVGYGSTRTIYDFVRSRPSCVVLLDEIDRCHPSIQDVLLSILEGQGKDADGLPVSFSQAIFILTTNQGQDRVIHAFQDYRRGQLPDRQAMAESFDDATLRHLILTGVVDRSEGQMQALVEEQLRRVKDRFEKEADEAERLRSIQGYLDLRRIHQGLLRGEDRPILDRALLDRIDFLIPFFPIKEPELLHHILEMELNRTGWRSCPRETRNRIVEEAGAQQESVRPLKRLVKKYLRTNRYSTEEESQDAMV
ncbi:MAG: AAA family ATPase [Deltaproteobacteria bacterium]|nr:AAA family ATPase [Deltaproteobacteria bacterium]